MSWPNPTAFQNMPHQEVNWALLAQQWIAMRQTGSENETARSESSQPLNEPAISTENNFSTVNYDGENQPYNASFATQQQSFDQQQQAVRWQGAISMQRDQFQMASFPQQPWQPTQQQPWPPHGPRMAAIPGGFHQIRPAERQPLINAPPRQHFHAQEYYTPRVRADHYGQMDDAGSWMGGDASAGALPAAFQSATAEITRQHDFPGQDMDYRKWGAPFRPFINRQQHSWLQDERSASNSPDFPVIDLQARKALPAWIREGLEKMEREKLKKQEEEEAEKLKAQQEAEKPKIGRFESDDSDAADSDREKDIVHDDTNRDDSVHTINRDRSPTPLTEEEYRDEMLMLLRQQMTEILLQVTNEEIEHVCQQAHRKALAKAKPKVLTQSSALAALQSSALTSLAGEADEDSDSSSGSRSQSAESDREEDGEASSVTSSSLHPAADAFKMPVAPVSVRSVSKHRKQNSSSATNNDHSEAPDNGGSRETTKEKSRWDSDSSRKKNSEAKEKEQHDLHTEPRKSAKSEHKRKKSKRSRSRSREREKRRRSRSRSHSRERDSQRHARKRSRSKERHNDRDRSTERESRRSRSNDRDRRSRSRERDSKRSRSKDRDSRRSRSRERQTRRSRSPRVRARKRSRSASPRSHRKKSSRDVR